VATLASKASKRAKVTLGRNPCEQSEQTSKGWCGDFARFARNPMGEIFSGCDLADGDFARFARKVSAKGRHLRVTGVSYLFSPSRTTSPLGGPCGRMAGSGGSRRLQTTWPSGSGAAAEDVLSFLRNRSRFDPADKESTTMTDEAAYRGFWQQHFTLLLLPHAPVLSSLHEAADKLSAAKGFLDGLSPDVEAERERGLFVTTLAIDYGLKMLEHFGLIDGPEPPMPGNLSQVKQTVDNLLSYAGNRPE